MQLLHAVEPVFDAFVRLAHDRVLARLDALHVDADRAVDDDAEVRGAPRHVGRARAGDERLGGNAPVVDAGAAEALALDDRGLAALRRRRAASGGPDWPVPMTMASNVCFIPKSPPSGALVRNHRRRYYLAAAMDVICVMAPGADVFSRSASSAARARATAMPATQAAQPRRSNSWPSTALPTRPPKK